jgi:hypothetical protein
VKDQNLKIAGISVTLLLHGALAAIVISKLGSGGGKDADAARFEGAVTIEASLAFKKIDDPSHQPQKKKRQLFRPPDAQRIATDQAQPPPPPDKDQKLKPNKDEIDVKSILDKNRPQDDDLSTHGVDQVPKAGAENGSEWGTEMEAKGDPYAGELKGRIYAAWKVPSLEAGKGEALGCVRLDKNGKVVDHQVKKSGNANLDRSVELALRDAEGMDKPVPDNLVELMTQKGICFRFQLEGN